MLQRHMYVFSCVRSPFHSPCAPSCPPIHVPPSPPQLRSLACTPPSPATSRSLTHVAGPIHEETNQDYRIQRLGFNVLQQPPLDPYPRDRIGPNRRLGIRIPLKEFPSIKPCPLTLRHRILGRSSCLYLIFDSMVCTCLRIDHLLYGGRS